MVCRDGRSTICKGRSTPKCYPAGESSSTSYTQGKVLEIDATGKVVWEAAVPSAYHATRLPNGNTLVSSHGTKRVVEVGRDGKIVWEKTLDSQVWRVHRR